MSALPYGEVDPVISFPFRVTQSDRIVTAGSCFAQHIARYLDQSGFNHFIAEPAHPLARGPVGVAHQYGVFSARYGNVYTSRQLLQLIQRALDQFAPAEDIWEKDDSFVDPFRPTIQPGGFISVDELRSDRAQHLRAVRRALRHADVFIFTLGLTETWSSREDGAIFPLCPGVEGGVFDPSRHTFVNLTLNDVVADMREAIGLLRRIRPSLRIILTVSPVPLAATAEDRHVLTSTVLSKATLRLAAEQICSTIKDVAYFPSYEIITGPHAGGRYYAEDLRNVTDSGVAHVMSLFFRHVAETPTNVVEPPSPSTDNPRKNAAETVTELLCEEALLDKVDKIPS